MENVNLNANFVEKSGQLKLRVNEGKFHEIVKEKAKLSKERATRRDSGTLGVSSLHKSIFLL